VKALTVQPGKKDSARLDDMPDPHPEGGAVLVETLGVGVCGTDVEIINGGYGWAPPGEDRLVLGHESLGRVVEAAGELSEGDLVVGIVRRPDPDPCPNCAVGEWDMCRNGKYTERGIKEIHGYCSEQYRIEADFAVRVDPSLERVGMLLEPASVVAKAWDHIERIGSRGRFAPKTAIVTGAGPIGLLAALLGRQRDLEVHVVDKVSDGPKPDLVAAMGATYHSNGLDDCPTADVIIECTGVGALVFAAIDKVGPDGIVCLTGVSASGRPIPVDAGALNRGMVLENAVVFGSVNANRRHYEKAAADLARADTAWLEGMITRRVPLDRWADALERQPDDVKVVIELAR
jgi:threonine dehydrogenase-like Zn-dependent dehydrogenase